MPTIDADAHVVESERTWDFMDPADVKYRPIVVTPRGEPDKEYWMIDGKVRGVARAVITAQDLKELSRQAGRNMDAPMEAREMEDVGVRLRHMDQLGIDVQVLYPTIFIEQVADRPEVDVAVCRGYNRWLADIWKQGEGRLRWICVPPLLSMPDALDELRWSKERGAVGIFMRGIEGDHLLHDPYFFPLYEEAVRLDMPVAVHIGNSNSEMASALAYGRGTNFWRFRLASVGAFHALIMNGIPQMFPGLRFGFAEAAAQWVPYVLRDLGRRLAAMGRPLPEYPLREYRLWVACQTDDDIPYVMQAAGEEQLFIGTDYGHNDQSTEIEALRNLREGGAVTELQYRKITYDNPKALYAL